MVAGGELQAAKGFGCCWTSSPVKLQRSGWSLEVAHATADPAVHSTMMRWHWRRRNSSFTDDGKNPKTRIAAALGRLGLNGWWLWIAGTVANPRVLFIGSERHGIGNLQIVSEKNTKNKSGILGDRGQYGS